MKKRLVYIILYTLYYISRQAIPMRSCLCCVQVARVLCVGGRYVCVMLAQECVLRLAVEHFVSLGWAVRLHCLQEADADEDSFPLPVFILICTRFRQPMPAPILEICQGEDGAPNRFAAVPELLSAVRELQSYAVLRKRLRTSTDASSSPSLTLSHAKTGLPRYTLTVQDSAPNAKVPRGNYFGIFIGEQAFSERLVLCVFRECWHFQGKMNI